jgi:hypothetical protein
MVKGITLANNLELTQKKKSLKKDQEKGRGRRKGKGNDVKFPI